MKYLNVLVLILLVIFSANSFAKKFAVVDLVPQGVNEGQAKLISNSLRTRLLTAAGGDVVPLAMQQQKLKAAGIEMKASNDVNYLLEVGKALEVEEVIGGKVSIDNGTFVLEIVDVSVKEGKVVGTLTQTSSAGYGDVMQNVLPIIAKKIADGSIKSDGGLEMPAELMTQAPEKEEAPAEEPAPAPQEKMYTVNIITDPPGVTVKINGEEKGQTPLQVELKKGIYQLELTLDTYETIIQQIFVDESHTDFAFELKKQEQTQPTQEAPIVSEEPEQKEGLPATVVIGTQPEGAQVIFDGQPIGYSNLLYNTTSGNHTITFKLDGYRDTTITTFIKGNENNILEVALTPSQVSADLAEDVSGASLRKRIIRIGLGLGSIGMFAAGVVINNQINDLYNQYKESYKPDEVKKLHDDIVNKEKMRNILYLGGGVFAAGFTVTFFLY